MKKQKYHASYVRVSTHMQQGGMESQLRSIEKYYKENEILNYKIFKDTAISGAKDSRPALNKMMDEIRNKNITQVTTFSFSRISRSCSHLLKCLETMRSNECSLVSLSEKIDTNTAIGQALVAVVGALSQLERDLIRERVIAGLARVKAEGRTLGRKKTRPSGLIRPLFVKGLSNRECARLASTSTGSVSKEILEMKKEMAKEEGMPSKKAHTIKADTLREYFYDDPFKIYNKIQMSKKDNLKIPAIPISASKKEKNHLELSRSVEIIT